jgi:hypothetical protein
MRIPALAALAAIALLLPHPALAGVHGVVYELANPKAPRDEWQRKPLANAYVVISWSITIPAPAHATSSCRHIEIARSNEKGEYVMDGPWFPTSALAHANLLAYAPGMDRVDWPWIERPEALKEISMARSERSADERLSTLMVLDGLSWSCYGQEIHDPQGVLKAYREALAAEGRTLNPVTQSGRSIQSSLEARIKPVPPPGTPMRVEVVPVDGQIQKHSLPAAPR